MAENPEIAGIEVGDEVRLRIGQQVLHAVVIEKRGPLGVDGEQIIRIQIVGIKDEEPDEFEVPESALEAVPS